MRRFVRLHPRLTGALSVVVPGTIALAAPSVLGERGTFLLEIFVSGGAALLTGWLGWHVLRAAAMTRSSVGVRVTIGAVGLVPLLFAAWTAVQFGGYVGDLVLPFDTVGATIVGWHLNGTRIVTTEINTAAGVTYATPTLDTRPPGLSSGPHRLLVTRIHRLVLEVLPAQ